MSTGSVQAPTPTITVGTPAGSCSATFPAPLRPNIIVTPPATSTTSGPAPLPTITVFPGAAAATGTTATPFVGQPVAHGVRETTLQLRSYETLLQLRFDEELLALAIFETRLVLRAEESDLDGRDTSTQLVRAL
jgi:hypothetical protein